MSDVSSATIVGVGVGHGESSLNAQQLPNSHPMFGSHPMYSSPPEALSSGRRPLPCDLEYPLPVGGQQPAQDRSNRGNPLKIAERK